MRLSEFLPNQVAAPKPGSFFIDKITSNKGPQVADLQKALVALGFPLPKYGVDGIRGPETSKAVKDFQQANSLQPTGKPDDGTVSALNNILKSKPDVASKLVKSTAADVKPGGKSGKSIDVSAIQDPDFNKKLEKVAAQLGVRSSDLIAVMKQESGVKPDAVNKQSGATGLIQFMPKTAAALGTTTADLVKMTAVEQLDYVYKYFKMVGVQPGMDLGDLYMAVFMPAHIGKPDNFVLGSSGAPGFRGKVYAQNRGLDKDRNGVITISDVKSAVQRYA
jgi:hypothetical protein